MPQLNDCIYHSLSQSGTGDQLNDLLLGFYQTNGATSNQLNDAEREFLIAQNVLPSQLNDMWFTHLRNLGYTGSLSDMKLTAWCAGNPAGANILVFDGSTVRATLATTQPLAANWSVEVVFSTQGELTLPLANEMTLISGENDFEFRIYIDRVTGFVVGEAGNGTTFVAQCTSTTNVTDGDQYTVNFNHNGGSDTYTIAVDNIVEDTLVTTAPVTTTVANVGASPTPDEYFEGVIYYVKADNTASSQSWTLNSGETDRERSFENPLDPDFDLLYVNVDDTDWLPNVEVVQHLDEIVYHLTETVTHISP